MGTIYCFNEFYKNNKMHVLYYHAFLYLVHFILSPFLTIYGLLAQLLHILLMTSHLFRVTMFNLLNNKYNIFLPSITVIISLIFVHQYGQQNLHWLSAQNKTTTIKTTKRAYNNTVKTKQRERIKRGKCEV